MLRISVIVPAYNSAAYIAIAVGSALGQTLSDIEVIVADDASTDETRQVVQALIASDRRVRLLMSQVNNGPSAARNRAVGAAAGEWIALLDADDRYDPRRLAHLLARAEALNADMVSDEYLLIEEGAGTTERRRGRGVENETIIDAYSFVRGTMPRPDDPRSNPSMLKPIIRASFLSEKNITYDESIRFGEDYAFYLECLLAGAKWIQVPEAFYFYSVRPNSLTACHDSQHLERFCRVDEVALAREEAQCDPLLRKALEEHLTSTQSRAHWALFVESWKARRLDVLVRSLVFSWPVFFHVVRQCAAQLLRRYRSALARADSAVVVE